jgi:hypothetical protein
MRNPVPTNATTHEESMAISNNHITSLSDRRYRSILTTRRNSSAAAVYTAVNSMFPTRKENEYTGR